MPFNYSMKWDFPRKGKTCRSFSANGFGWLGKGDTGQVGVSIALWNGNQVTPTSGSHG